MATKFMEMMLCMERCTNASITLYDEIKNNPRLNSVVVFEPHPGEHCFRVKFSNPIGKVKWLSISYPMDIYENKHRKPKTIETALVDVEGELCYVKELGYYDMCRFSSANEIVEEILRVSSTNN